MKGKGSLVCIFLVRHLLRMPPLDTLNRVRTIPIFSKYTHLSLRESTDMPPGVASSLSGCLRRLCGYQLTYDLQWD